MASHPRIAALASASLIALGSLSAPAMALGKKERNVLAGLAAAVVISQLLDSNSATAATPVNHRPDPRPDPRYDPRFDPRFDPRYDHGFDPRAGHGPSGWQKPRPPMPPHAPAPVAPQATIYSTPLAKAFNSYNYADRIRIQRRLRAAGYYAGAIDGAFGPRSYEGLRLYARAMGYERGLTTAAGAFSFLDRVLR